MLSSFSQHLAHSQCPSSGGFQHLIHPPSHEQPITDRQGETARHHQERAKHKMGAVMLSNQT